MTTTKPAEAMKVPETPPGPEKLSGLDFLILAFVGALGGGLLWLIVDSDLVDDGLKPLFIAFVLSFAAGFTLLWRRKAIVLRLGFIAAQAALLSVLTWLSMAGGANNDTASFIFWMLLGGPLLGFLMSSFARASFRQRALFWPYKALWQSGSSILADMFIAGVVGLAAIAFVALWGVAFKSFDIGWAAKITHSTAFLLPLGGGTATLAGGLARSNARLGEAVRSILLIGCRIGLPLAALFSLTFAFGIVGGGTENLEKVPVTPAGLLLALALLSELIFNGVYQDGARKPPRWLRLSAWVALAILPIYTIAAATALWMRVDSYGLTPSRMIALIALTLTAIYTVLLLVGLVSELIAGRWENWMPPVAKLNTGMAVVWMLTLVLMQTPLLDPVGVSARNQAGRLISGKVKPEAFDFGFLKFKLGRPGERAMAHLASLKNPAIQAGLDRANAASDYWDYKSEAVEDDTPGGDLAPQDQALVQINAMLLPSGMIMTNAGNFDYGALLYTRAEAGETAFTALGQWAGGFSADDNGTVRIMRDRIGQGIIAARLAQSREGWESAQDAARAAQKTFKNDIKSVGWAVRQLGEMAGEDRSVRELFENHTRNAEDVPSAQAVLEILYAGVLVDEMDARHLEKLKVLLRGKAWFDPQKIGRYGEQNAWLIVLHANHDLDFQEKVLAAIEPRALAGGFDARRYAHLYDTVARARSKPQRYGTKSLCEDGRWVVDVTEDPGRVDERRAQMGLAPLAQTLAQENARFGQCQS